MSEPRITIEDSAKSAITKMSEGNIGALTVMLNIMEKAQIIDPNATMGGLKQLQ